VKNVEEFDKNFYFIVKTRGKSEGEKVIVSFKAANSLLVLR
jgi:hypothetical protein